MSGALTGRRVLVTGGSGFIGTNLVEHLRAIGADVLSIDSAQPRNPDGIDVHRTVDLLDGAAVSSTVDELRPEYVFHLAARTDLAGETLRDYSANTDGVRNLLGALGANDALARVIVASSMLVCRFGYIPKDEFDVSPDTVYGESKVETERFTRETDLPWVLARPTSIWGPWFGPPYRDFFEVIKRRRYVQPGRRSPQQTYGYVGNTAEQLVTLATTDSEVIGRTFDLADWPAMDLHAWANSIADAFDVRRPPTVPLSALRAAGYLGDFAERVTGRTAPLTSFRLRNLITDNVLDLAPLIEIHRELTHSVDDGVRRTVESMITDGASDD
jgi:nucleoside-diphosphate-sugar epimerase